jgi:hypothetical protein
MWFNSTQRAEPYLGWKVIGTLVKAGGARKGAGGQVLHGCRQLVS